MPKPNFICAGIQVNGSIHGHGDLMLAGGVDGKIQMDGDIVITERATINAPMTGKNVDIAGHVTGNIEAEGTLRLASQASIQGDIRTQTLDIAPEASVRGTISMVLDLPKTIGQGNSF